jgi:hypothetical protein
MSSALSAAAGLLKSKEGFVPKEVVMRTTPQPRTRSRAVEHEARPEPQPPNTARPGALAEIARAVRDDCRADPKSYLGEARAAASGE